jgi:hypothetical protein
MCIILLYGHKPTGLKFLIVFVLSFFNYCHENNLMNKYLHVIEI